MARGVVLGGSSGIGRALVDRLGATGDEVTVMSRNAAAATLPSHVRAVTVDLREHGSVDAAFATVADGRPLDYVVNCAGVGFYAPIGEDHTKTWNDILSTNVTGLLNLLSVIETRCPRLRRLLHVSSMAAHRPSLTPGNTCYAAAKTAASTIVADYRARLRAEGRNTTVSVVSPGVVAGTGFAASFYSRVPDRHDQGAALRDAPGLRAEDVADLLAHVLRLPEGLEVLDLQVNLRGLP